MSDKGIVKSDTGQVLQVHAPALNGDQVARSLIMQQRLTNEALQNRRSFLQLLFPSKLTKAIRAVEHDIVMDQLETTRDILSYILDAGKTIVRTKLDHIIINGTADALADTSSRLLPRREELEAILTAAWRRFCESAAEEQRWAATMPPSIRKLALQKVEANLNGFYSMMEAMLREFEEFVRLKVGR